MRSRQNSIGKLSLIHPRPIATDTVVYADETASWENRHVRFEVKRINHQEAYSLDGDCPNIAEKYIYRLRRAKIGIHHQFAAACLLRYGQESSWREDNRRVSNGAQVNRVAALGVEARQERWLRWILAKIISGV